ncbi:hypothetical protein OAP51_04310 [Alphaproteobacteria bacterium]|nr:hypothetical protein [Alphaproteobacteria bacterium]
MENRLMRALESVLFIAIFLGIYWVIGFFCKSTFDFEIRNSKGYTIVVFAAIAFKIGLTRVLVG